MISGILRVLFFLGLAAVLFSGPAVDTSHAVMAKSHKVDPGEKSAVTAEAGVGKVRIGSVRNYATLPDLVEAVCGGAIEHFYNFFGPGTVDVLPLEVVGELPGRRVTTLGVTIADQMAARVSNDSLSKLVMEGADRPQEIRGVLQELDGHLRIHLNGVNDRGERRSYVTTVEMSELVYRALHTFI